MNFIIQLTEKYKINIFETISVIFVLLFLIPKKVFYKTNCFFGLEGSLKDQVTYYSSIAVPAGVVLILMFYVS